MSHIDFQLLLIALINLSEPGWIENVNDEEFVLFAALNPSSL